MIDDILVEDLSNAPPHDWALLNERAEVLQRFIDVDVSTAMADAGAAELRVTRRYFNKLLKAYRERHTGGPSKGPRTGFACWIGEGKEQVVADALSNVGPGGRLSEVYREAVRLSQERGLEPPSETSVRTRFGKPRSEIRLRERLNAQCDLLVDLCGVELNLLDRNGAIAPALLLVIIETSTARVLHHTLYDGRPTAPHIASTIAKWLANVKPSGATIEMTAELVDAEKLLASSLTASWRPRPRRIRSGSAIRAVFGRKVGRLATRADTKTWSQLAPFPPVPLHVASRVLAYLVTQRNSGTPTLPTSAFVQQSSSLLFLNSNEHRAEECMEVGSDPIEATSTI